MQRNAGADRIERNATTMSTAAGLRDRSILRAATAGLAYFALVFAAGFALGTLRVVVLTPRLGDPATAVLLELPVMLGLSWMACRWLIARLDVPTAVSARLVMGGSAFATLMVAELGVSVLAFGRTLPAHLEHYRQLPTLLGLAGQMAFAVFPVIQGTTGARKSAS